jgi:hypothetical protein
MKFLRDESGHVLLFPSIRGRHFHSKQTDATTAATPDAPPEPIRIELKGSLLPPTQHCRFYCQNCGEQILLPHDKMGMAFAGPFLRKIEARSIGAVCGACAHVAGFSLFRGCYGFDTRNKLVDVAPNGKTALVDWLKCEEETCTFPLPLFLTTEDELIGERAKEFAASWDWRDLECTAGHRIKAPAWIYDRKPYELPRLLR